MTQPDSMVLALVVLWLLSLVVPPVIHFVGFRRHYHYTRPAAVLSLVAALQAVLLVGVIQLVSFTLTLGAIAISGTAKLEGLAYIVQNAIAVCFIVANNHTKQAGSIALGLLSLIYFASRLPVDKTALAFWGRTKHTLFYRREDEYLYECACRFWEENGGDVSAVDEADYSAEQRGRIIGYYLDKAFKGQTGPVPSADLTTARLPNASPAIFGRSVIVRTYALLIAFLLYLGARDFIGQPTAAESERIVELVMFFTFGALFAENPLVRQIAEWTIPCVFLASLLPLAPMRWIMLLSLWVYIGMSFAALPAANAQWESLIAVQVMNYLDSTLFAVADMLSSGLVSVLKSLLQFSLSHVFGLSVVLWLAYAGRVTLSALGRTGRLFFTNRPIRPDALGGHRRKFPPLRSRLDPAPSLEELVAKHGWFARRSSKPVAPRGPWER